MKHQRKSKRLQQTFNHLDLITSYEIQSDSVNNANDTKAKNIRAKSKARLRK